MQRLTSKDATSRADIPRGNINKRCEVFNVAAIERLLDRMSSESESPGSDLVLAGPLMTWAHMKLPVNCSSSASGYRGVLSCFPNPDSTARQDLEMTPKVTSQAV